MSVKSQPALDGVAVTLTDDFEFAAGKPADALYVGTGGTVVLLTKADTELTFVNVSSGVILPIGAISVKSTANGTTASNIIGLYS